MTDIKLNKENLEQVQGGSILSAIPVTMKETLDMNNRKGNGDVPRNTGSLGGGNSEAFY